jgi:hypothetical protein
MQVMPVSRVLFALLFFGVGLSGCLPSGRSPLDEEKESHFLAGKSRVNALDYQGGPRMF